LRFSEPRGRAFGFAKMQPKGTKRSGRVRACRGREVKQWPPKRPVDYTQPAGGLDVQAKGHRRYSASGCEQTTGRLLEQRDGNKQVCRAPVAGGYEEAFGASEDDLASGVLQRRASSSRAITSSSVTGRKSSYH